MKTIIAGSRSIWHQAAIEVAVEKSGFDVTEVVSGCAKGVDAAGERWAGRRHIPVRRFPAKWGEYGKQAGYIRNIEMAQYADALIAVWDGKSRGTQHMIRVAQDQGIHVHIHYMTAVVFPGKPTKA